VDRLTSPMTDFGAHEVPLNPIRNRRYGHSPTIFPILLAIRLG
jgi:hypothetical protein